MGWIGTLYWLLLRRLRSSWALLAITSFGILAAVTLMSMGAVYSQVLAEGGLQHTLATIDQRVLNVQVIAQNRPLGPPDYQRLRTQVEDISKARLGNLIRGVERLGQTQGNLPVAMKNDLRGPDGAAPMGRPFFLTGFQDHSRLVEGRWPETAPVLHERGLDMEIAIGQRTARSIGLNLGTQIFLLPFSSDPSEVIALTIVGLMEPVDPREEYWMFSPAYFSVQQYGDDVLLPLYVPEEHFFSGMGAKYPSLVGDFGWFLFLDASGLTAGTAGPAKDALAGLESDINKQFPRTLVLTGLKNRILAYERTLTLARVPLFLFISLVVVVILYFLALIMGLIARSQADEAGLLRSRGAGALQVAGLLVLGEGIVVMMAVAVGPFLALALVRYVLLGTIDPVVGNPEAGGTGAVTVEISASMFWMGAIGGLLSLGVLAVSGWSRARNGIVESLAARARPPTVPFVHRYYIDVLVIAAWALVEWQIRGRGGFATQDLDSNSLAVDYTLLLVPILRLIGVAVITLRVLPWLVRGFAWISSRAGPAWMAFPMVRLARDPLPHGSLLVILLLATALGVFGSAFQASLSKSQIEQALYRVGGDLVLTGQTFTESLQRDIASINGVSSVTPLFMKQVTQISRGSNPRTFLLATDPVTLPNTIWFRDDFAATELEELLSPLHQARYIAPASSVDPGMGIELPGGIDSLGVWVKPAALERSTVARELNLWARVEDSEGRSRHVLVGDLMASQPAPQAAGFGLFQPASQAQAELDWQYHQVSLQDAVESMEPPIRLVAFFISQDAFTRLPPGTIFMDDITSIGPRDGDTVGDTVNDAVGDTVIEGFEGAVPWVVLPNEGAVPDVLEKSPEAARSGYRGLSFSWEEPFSRIPRGIMIPPGPYPLPAIGGSTYQVGESVRPKVNGQIVPMTVTGKVRYFPTINPPTQPMLIASLEDFRQYLKRIPRGNYDPPERLWLALDRGADRQRVIEAIDERVSVAVVIKDREKAVDLARRDPLAGGGWNGLTLLGMATITIAVLLTLALHGVAEVRTGRVDLTVAQTLGLSRLQLIVSLALERVVVAILGIGTGAVVGLWLGRSVLGYLDITPGGNPVIPPMITIVEGWVAALVVGGLAAATVLAFVFVAMAARRLRVPEILRMGE
ncbi:MAG: hypothetical protein BZY88_09985 [SAR202 cluster bacterium Io17-Chloro-G9]|nr:MAG: hypothetical protein BZY88_09985 [SAR202 cluster bacterium Io17-Chloro-G9]